MITDGFRKLIRYSIIIAVFALLFINLVSLARKVPFHPDEISWFFHTSFYEKVFLDKNASDKIFWSSYESFDQPVLSKYIFGAYLFMENKNIFQVRRMLEQQYGRWSFYNTLDESVIEKTAFVPFIFQMREVNLGITFFTLILIFLLYVRLFDNVLFALLLPWVLERNTLFLSASLRATNDIHFIFLCLLGLYIFIMNTKEINLKDTCLFGICCGLAVSSKLTGIVLFISSTIFELLCFIYFNKEIYLKRALLICLVSFGCWFVLNPALYSSPITTSLRYISFRNNQSALFQVAYPSISLATYGDKIHAFFCILGHISCMHNIFQGYTIQNGYFNLILFIFGIICLSIRFKKQKNEQGRLAFAYLFFLFVLLLSVVYIPVLFDRYFLFPIIIVSLIEMYAVQVICKIVFSRFLFRNVKPRRIAGVL